MEAFSERWFTINSLYMTGISLIITTIYTIYFEFWIFPYMNQQHFAYFVILCSLLTAYTGDILLSFGMIYRKFEFLLASLASLGILVLSKVLFFFITQSVRHQNFLLTYLLFGLFDAYRFIVTNNLIKCLLKMETTVTQRSVSSRTTSQNPMPNLGSTAYANREMKVFDARQLAEKLESQLDV
ncbi:unnamed protein product, partial [Mesorhabditis belari]|uniref:Transmembrane protein n=1 Tax=Mesorhabditis belari TaxID=2138241 RepID=A0AAF3FKZ3_9BILA